VKSCAGHTIYQASDDADTLVAKHALLKASEKTSGKVSVIDNDTDILILLVYHLKAIMCHVVMHSVKKCGSFSIRNIWQRLGTVVVSRLLVIHGISGCETTSGL
jgi:hypothetical protein